MAPSEAFWFQRVGPGPRPGPQSCDGLKVADLAWRVFTGNTQLCISGQIWFLYENPSQAHNYKYTQMHIHEPELGPDGRVCVQCAETKPSCSQELLQNGAGGFLLHYGLAVQLNISPFFFFKRKLFCTHSPLKHSAPSSLSAVSGEGGVTVR